MTEFDGRLNQSQFASPDPHHAQAPAFIITIDTEGDNVWERPRETTTRNAKYLARFQALCAKYGLKTTYLTAWEMALSPEFQELGHEIKRCGQGEIGMHLHAWNSPPVEPLTGDDRLHLPYLIEYPERQIREKVRRLSCTLEDVFGEKMVSHRAGRWAFNELYAQVLIENGYLIDCSVTPFVSWQDRKGAPNGSGGTDFSNFPDCAYYVDATDISKPGESRLLEVPVTIIKRKESASRRAGYLVGRLTGSRKMASHYGQSPLWLRPNGKNLAQMLEVIRIALAERRDYVEFMLHSSELMPGGSPNFQSVDSIEALYDDLEAVFAAARASFQGCSLQEYYQRVESRGLQSKSACSVSQSSSLV